MMKKFPKLSELPSGLTEAPFTWDYWSNFHDMELVSGYFGYELTGDEYIRPVVGWAIGERVKPSDLDLDLDRY